MLTGWAESGISKNRKKTNGYITKAMSRWCSWCLLLLLWNINRMSWVPDRVVSFSMILSDPNPGFKVTVCLQVEYRRNCAFSSSSSSSSAPISENSRLHKLTPLWTILRTHPRCVETNVVGQRSSSIVRSHVHLGRPARRRQSAGGRYGCSKNARVVLWWVGSRKMPEQRTALNAL